MKFKATAIVSVYRAGPFIYHKIRNLLQSNVPIQIILVECNNGKELKPVNDLIQTDQFVRLIYPKRIPIWRAVNAGIMLARTPYVVQANTDDLVHPEAYQEQIKALDAGADIAYFDYHMVYGFQRTWAKAKDKAYCKYVTPQAGYSPGNGLGPFPMWKKSLHDKHGLFDEKMEIFGDADFWGKLAKDPDTQWGRIPRVLGAYANRNNNLEKNERLRKKDRDYIKQKRREST